MTPLATPLDVVERLGRALSESEELRIEALLRDASAAVRKRSTQQFTVGESTVTLIRLPSGGVQLPQRPVVEIDTVTDINDNPLSYTQVNDRLVVTGIPVNSFEVEPWRSPITMVKVTYTHGYEEIPDDIVAVVCSLAARALGTAPDQSGITQESIDGYSYSTGSAAASGALGMLPNEIDVCDRYRNVPTSIPVTL